MIASKDDFVGKGHRSEPDGVWKEQLREQPAPEFDGVQLQTTALDDSPPPVRPIMRSRFARALSQLYAHFVSRTDQPPEEEKPPRPSADDSPNRNTERRAFPRRESGCEVSICLRRETGLLTQQEMAWRLHSSTRKGSLVDVSMNGVAFLLNEPIEKGEELLLRLTNRQFAKNVDTHAHVLRALSDGDGQWRIICQFQKNLTFEQVHDLGRHLFQSDFV